MLDDNTKEILARGFAEQRRIADEWEKKVRESNGDEGACMTHYIVAARAVGYEQALTDALQGEDVQAVISRAKEIAQRAGANA